MIVISDTSVISGLIIVGHVDILTKLFKEIYIPKAVKDELIHLTKFQTEVLAFFDNQHIHTVEPQSSSLLNELLLILDKGEAHAICLFFEIKADLLCIDEKKGRIIAEQFDIRITGLLGLLILAKQKGLIPNVRQVMDKLQSQAGFWIGKSLYNKVLLRSNERQ